VGGRFANLGKRLPALRAGLWVHRWRQEKAPGDVIVIRYADDFIAGFQHEWEAKAFQLDLQERLRKFELALHPAKTRLIRFGRYAAKQREGRGEGKPESKRCSGTLAGSADAAYAAILISGARAGLA
jgi:hypothetical protein